MSQLIDNYNRPNLLVRPVFVTFDFLCQAIYATIRKTHAGFIPTPSIEARIRDLWLLGAPHPQTWQRRLLLPREYKQLAREIGREVGAQITRQNA